MMRILPTPSTEDIGKQLKSQLKPKNKGSNKNKQDDSKGGRTHLKGVAKVKDFFESFYHNIRVLA